MAVVPVRCHVACNCRGLRLHLLAPARRCRQPIPLILSRPSCFDKRHRNPWATAVTCDEAARGLDFESIGRHRADAKDTHADVSEAGALLDDDPTRDDHAEVWQSADRRRADRERPEPSVRVW